MKQFALHPRHAILWLASGLIFLQSVLPLGMACADGLAGVSGGTVVAGQAAITQDASTLNVNTMTDRTIINWNGFSIGAGETANFFQPGANSAVLNRVTTPNNPSAIFGAMNSNGNVILVNPSGIVVGAGGVINTNGFTASVLDIPNNEFLKGGVLNFRGDSTASVINEGTIHTGSGGAALIGGNVINNGTITSEGGSISLATGGSVTLSDGSRLTHADMATIETGISPTAGLIQNSGTIRATGAMETGGEVFLVNPGGKIMHNGTIAAYRNNPTGQIGGDVKIAAKGGSAEVSGVIDVSAQAGGSVTVEAGKIQVAAATINASGTSGGGQINIGGGFQGNDASIANAKITSVDEDSVINADATDNGNGGQVVLWSDEATEFYGVISSTGGINGGDGGLVEVSGASLVFDGAVDTSAAMGGAGWLLLDPVGIRIISGGQGRPMPGTDPVLTLTDGTLNSLMQFNNVLLATSPTKTTVIIDPGGDDNGRGGTGPNDDNIVVSAGTALNTGNNILFFSTSTVDLYADIAGHVAGGTESNSFLEGIVIKDPDVVNVYDAGITTGSIQDAVDMIASGGTVNVGDGSFDGGVNVNKSLSLLGDGSTNTSVINVPSGGVGMTVTSNGSTIDGFRFEGTGTGTGIQLGAGFSPARNTTIQDVAFDGLTDGIVGRNVDDNLTISDVRMRNIAEQGIEFRRFLDADDVVLIEDANIVSQREAVSFGGSLNGTRVTIRSSRLVSRGADAVRFAAPIRFSNVLIGGSNSSDENRITGGDDGIDVDGSLLTSNLSIVGNRGIWGGDDAIDIDGDVLFGSVVDIADNRTIAGADDAINFDGTVFLSRVAVTDNQRINAEDDGISFRNVALGGVVIAGNRVSPGTTGAGLNLTYSLSSQLEIGPENVLEGGADGIVINGASGATLLLVGNTINDTAFAGQTGDYIRLEDTALFSPGSPTVIDAKDATFEGLKGSAMTAAQLFATEDKMFHFPDDKTLGLFDISELFVVQGESIQLAVNAAGALGGAQEVVVGSGTFGGSVEVWVDDLTMQGNDNSTVIDTDAVDPFANNGDRNNGFEVVARSETAGFLGAVTDVTIDGFRFDTLSSIRNNTGVVLGHDFSLLHPAGNATIQNSTFNDLNDGIVANDIFGRTTISNVTMEGIGQQGIDIRPLLSIDDTIAIEDSKIESRRESVRFDNLITGGEIRIQGSDLESSTRDAVQFRRAVADSEILIGGTAPGQGNRLKGDDQGIDVDSSLTLSRFSVVGNSLIEGGDQGLRFDGDVSLDQIAIVGNGEIIGRDHGIQFDETVRVSRIDISGNKDIIAQFGDGIVFASPIERSILNVGATLIDLGEGMQLVRGNGRIGGADDGINIDAISRSLFTVTDNGLIIGESGSALEFEGTVGNSLVAIAKNEVISGSEEGIEFDTNIQQSTVLIGGNDYILGKTAAIQFKRSIVDSVVSIGGRGTIFGNQVISGDLGGIEFQEDLVDSTVVIGENGLIQSTTTGDAIEFGSSADIRGGNASLSIVRNDLIRGVESGIEFNGVVQDAPVIIQGNTVKGQTGAGVEIDAPLWHANVTIGGPSQNDGNDISGHFAGVVIRQVDGGSLVVSNNTIETQINGILLAGDLLDDASVLISTNSIKGTSGIMHPAMSILDSADLQIRENTILLRATDFGIGIWLGRIGSSKPVVVQGGSTTGGGTGLLVSTFLQEPLSGRIIIDGFVVNDTAKHGLHFQTYPFGGLMPLEVTLQNGVTINRGGPDHVGMVFDARGLSLTGNTLADSRFFDTQGNFIELRNGALFEPGRPTLIDGTGVYWDGLNPAVASQRQQIIDRIVDFLDDQTLGLIFPGAGLADDQTYDRFTRYQDFFRTYGDLMGPFPVGRIIYRTPTIEIAEGLEDQAADEPAAEDTSQREDRPAEKSAEANGIDLVSN